MAHRLARTAVVIPNWDGADMIEAALESLRHQTLPHTLVVVDNGSRDNSLQILRPLAEKGRLVLIEREKNYGFTGGVVPGMLWAIDHDCDSVALFNNDAVADCDWLKNLHERLMREPQAGIVTAKILSSDGSTIDSTGDWLTIWGLPYPRGRGEPNSSKYDKQTRIFGASGGASIYRCEALKQVGVFDQDFFAYYEDIDLSFRIRLAGWEICFEPKAVVYHKISATGNRVKGFTTLQTMKNLPWVLIKDVPGKILWHMYPRFVLAYIMFFGRAITDGRGWWAFRGWLISLWLTPKKLVLRHQIQSNRVVSVDDINQLIMHDLPPNATKLRHLRQAWWRLRGKAK